MADLEKAYADAGGHLRRFNIMGLDITGLGSLF